MVLLKLKWGIVAFAFGEDAHIRANEQIARAVAWEARILASKSKYPKDVVGVFTQSDIDVNGLGLGMPILYAQQAEGSLPPPTLRIAREAVNWACLNSVSILLVVAAKPHLRRALRDTRMAIREIGADIEVMSATSVSGYLTKSWFCPDSLQERTRSRLKWWPREIILRLMPFFIYKRVAS